MGLGDAGWTRAGLKAGIAVPFAYFGTQAVAMPLYPGYDLLRQPASELGSSAAPMGWVFNCGAILTGLLTIAAACGIGRALAARGAWTGLAGFTGLALLSSGAASLNAGFFNLPDPRHNPGWLGIGMFLFPILLLLAIWPVPGSGRLKLALLACLAALAVIAPVMAGLTEIDRGQYGGLLQRFVALDLFLPVALGAVWLLGRGRSRSVAGAT